MADKNRPSNETGPGVSGVRGEGGTDITGGTDKFGKGGRSIESSHAGGSGARETGDISGASSTHAGAGGVMDNTGGTGTAPTGGDQS